MQLIKSLTHNALGRTEDGELVARVLPDEEVEVLEDGSARILKPSPDRVAPPCRHFKACGGCALQHASDRFVAEWKASVVQKALAAQGIDFAPEHVETSPANSRRRAKFSGKRTKKGAMVGFHAKGSGTIVEIPDCKLLTPELIALIPTLEALTVAAASRKGEIDITVIQSEAGPDIHVETDKELTEAIRIEMAEFARIHNIARLVWKDEPIVTMNPPEQRFGAARVVPPPGSFLQATKAGEAALQSFVIETVGKALSVIDLFSGCGTFSLPLAKTAEVHAVEGIREMLAALDRGWREASGLKLVTTETRDLFRRPLEPDELARFKAIVIDPPRAGAEAQIEAITRSAVPVVAMVSCSPVTFARDAKTLVDAGWNLERLIVVDQFRWSSHVEIAGAFTRS